MRPQKGAVIMSWNEFEKEAASGSWVKLNVGMSAELVILELVEFFTKEWDGGKTERMVRFKVIDAADPDGGEKELEVGVRRAKPLNDLQLEMRQRGVDIASRLVRIDCYAEKHPTKPGRTIGRWRCVDTGPAPASLLGSGVPF